MSVLLALPLPLRRISIFYYFKRSTKVTLNLCSITPPSAPMQWWLNPSAGSSPEWERIAKPREYVRTKPVQTSVFPRKGDGQEKCADRGEGRGAADPNCRATGGTAKYSHVECQILLTNS